MTPGDFLGPILRTVDRVFAACEGLTPEQLAWRPAGGANSLAAIATHVLGNLDEVLLGTLLGRPSNRDREAEFVPGPTTAAELAARWAATRARIGELAADLTSASLDATYTHPRRGDMTGAQLLLTIARHMSEHEGQAALTRQLLASPQSDL